MLPLLKRISVRARKKQFKDENFNDIQQLIPNVPCSHTTLI